MARIRSIHPGIWTDENFAMLSHASRVLLFGIWTEADDHGVFEWKPVGLKMKIFPADKVDMEPLLGELVIFKMVKEFHHGDVKYGLVRNFCRFQRPKKPSFKHVLPDEFRTYVGLSDDSSEPVPHQFPTGTENSPQMEEGGGNRRREKKDSIPTVYAFEVGIIRLTEKDFRQWKENFEHIDVGAELIGLATWAQEQGPQRWFSAVSGALAKRNREARARVDAAQNGPDPNSPELWSSGIPGVT